MGSFYQPPPPAWSPGQYNTGSTGGSSVSGGWNPFAQRDVYNMYQQIGQNQFQQTQDQGNNQANLANYYLNNEAAAGNQVQGVLQPWLNGQGGYNPTQQANVTQQGGINYAQNQAGYNFLTPEEQANIAGNPYQASQQFQGANANLQQSVGQNGIAQDEAVTGGQTVGNQDLAQMQQGYQQAIDPSKLSVSGGYMPSVNAALGTGASQLQAAQGNPGLNITQQYLDQAGVSDQQVQDIAEAGARQVGAQFGATKDATAQAARAAGVGTPLGIASAETALDRSSAAAQSDALTNARLQALAAQRGAAQNIQNTQLNAGQYQSGLASSNALAEQNANIAAQTTGQQLNLGANQYISQAQQNAAQNLGTAALGQNQFITNAATQSLQNQMSNSGQAQEFGATTNAGLTSAAEAAQAGRAQSIAGQRVAANQANQNFGLQSSQALSQNYQNAYAPGLAQQNLAFNAAQGNQQYQGSQANAAQGRQLNWNGQQQSGENMAAGGYSNWGQNQQQTAGVGGFINDISKLAGAAQSGAGTFNSTTGGGSSAGANSTTGGYNKQSARGSFIDHHQLIEVGEHDRPEVILPLDPATPPQHQNIYEKMGSQLGHQLGIKGYAAGGMINADQNDFTRDLDQDEAATPDSGGTMDPNSPYPIRPYARGGMVQPGLRQPAQPQQLAPPPPGAQGSPISAPQQQSMNFDPSSFAVGGYNASAPSNNLGGGSPPPQGPAPALYQPQMGQPGMRRQPMAQMPSQAYGPIGTTPQGVQQWAPAQFPGGGGVPLTPAQMAQSYQNPPQTMAGGSLGSIAGGSAAGAAAQQGQHQSMEQQQGYRPQGYEGSQQSSPGYSTGVQGRGWQGGYGQPQQPQGGWNNMQQSAARAGGWGQQQSQSSQSSNSYGGGGASSPYAAASAPGGYHDTSMTPQQGGGYGQQQKQGQGQQSSFARGGVVAPRMHMPPIQGGFHPEVHLNMPIMTPRMRTAIRPAPLPAGGTQKFERGGPVMGNYRRNMGTHNQGQPMPFSEMGMVGRR